MRRHAFAVSCLVLATHRPSFAEDAAPTRTEAVTTPIASPRLEPPWTSQQTAGVVVILAALAAGVALTSYGLTFDCGETDISCHRRAAAPIWGGVGVAAAGSLVGLRLLQPSGSASSSSAVVTLQGTF
jgi:hypothetical protein